MTLPAITALPATPDRALSQEAFSAAVKAWMDAFGASVAQFNAAFAAIPGEVMGIDYNGTSTTSLTVGTGSKTLTIQTGKLTQLGQIYTLADSAAPSTNWMVGRVTAYISGTGSLTVDVSSSGGSGTKTAWTVSLGATGDAVMKTGGTMSGLLALVASAAGFASANIGDGVDPTTPANGDVWRVGTAVKARLGGTTRQVSFQDAAETLLNKTLGSVALTSSVTEQTYAITDGAAFEINPGNGTFQSVTLGAGRTPKSTSFGNGQSCTLLVDDGTGFTLTWTDGTFGGTGVKWLEGSAPSLAATGWTWIGLSKISGQVYGWKMGESG